MKRSLGCRDGDIHMFVVLAPALHRSGQRSEHTGASLQLAYLGAGTWEEEVSGACTEISFPRGKKLL